ncbi:MAG TPA: hypothetical protein VGH39_10665 [Xanthobacteraceae bacterium]
MQLANHVQKAENESVRIVGIDGLMAQDIEGALMEMDALGTMLRTDKTLYHGIISPEPGKDFAMTEADWDFTRKAFLKGMGFEGQPFIEIEHEKFGKDGVLRLHRHIITALAHAEAGYTRAIHTGHNFRKHEEIARCRTPAGPRTRAGRAYRPLWHRAPGTHYHHCRAARSRARRRQRQRSKKPSEPNCGMPPTAARR